MRQNVTNTTNITRISPIWFLRASLFKEEGREAVGGEIKGINISKC